MLKILAPAAAALVLAACGSSATEPKFGDQLSVKINASTRMPSDTTSVVFTDVTADSRCAQGVQCVWEGDAAVVFTVGGTQHVTLHTSPSAGPVSTTIGNRVLTLVSVAPTPKVGQTIAKADYVVVIRFDKGLVQ